jgi:hypothetical protein
MLMQGVMGVLVFTVNKVLWAVVVADTVFVVDLLSGFQLTAKNLLHCETVCINVLVTNGIPDSVIPTDVSH